MSPAIQAAEGRRELEADALWTWPARQVVHALHRGEITPAEVVEAAIARIESVDAIVNCLPIRDFDRARQRASAMTGRAQATLLAGLPVPIKDLADVAGLPTTLGDPARTDPVAVSDALVARLEARGGIVIGKTNVPFLGLGSDTDNPLFGLTVNPWNTEYSTAGSSGGAAAALACGAAWLAHGSDLGGSIRGPASHCGVVGLRPSPGRVGHGGPGTRRMPLDMLTVDGPMARDVADLALLLDALAGFEPADPFSLPSPPGAYQDAAERPALPRQIIAMPQMDGVEVAPAVRAVFDATIGKLSAAGVDIAADGPDFHGIADAAYRLRLGAIRARTPPEEIARIAAHQSEIARRTYADAATLDFDAYLAAGERQQALVCSMTAALGPDRMLLTPAVSHPPRRHRRGVPDQPPPQGNWAREAVFAYGITLSLCPAIVLPAGVSAEGLPIGVQLVGPPRGEGALLTAARAVEAVLGFSGRLPMEPYDPGNKHQTIQQSGN